MDEELKSYLLDMEVRLRSHITAECERLILAFRGGPEPAAESLNRYVAERIAQGKTPIP
jgi:hypothetical protein